MLIKLIYIAIICSLVVILIGLIPLYKYHFISTHLNKIIAFNTGLLLTIATIDLIPDALDLTPNSAIFVSIGILGLFVLKQFDNIHDHNEIHNIEVSKTSIKGLIVGSIVHSFFDGLLIIIGFLIEPKIGVLLVISMLLHKFTEGISISSLFLLLINNRLKVVLLLVLLGILNFIGSITGLILINKLHILKIISGVALGLSAGFFIYIACVELIPILNSAKDKKITYYPIFGLLLYLFLHFII